MTRFIRKNDLPLIWEHHHHWLLHPSKQRVNIQKPLRKSWYIIFLKRGGVSNQKHVLVCFPLWITSFALSHRCNENKCSSVHMHSSTCGFMRPQWKRYHDPAAICLNSNCTGGRDEMMSGWRVRDRNWRDVGEEARGYSGEDVGGLSVAVHLLTSCLNKT